MKKQDKPHTAIKITDEAKGNVFEGCTIVGAVEIDKQAEENRFLDSNIILPHKQPSSPPKKWYERPFGIFLLGVVASLVAAALWYYFSQYHQGRS